MSEGVISVTLRLRWSGQGAELLLDELCAPLEGRRVLSHVSETVERLVRELLAEGMPDLLQPELSGLGAFITPALLERWVSQ